MAWAESVYMNRPNESRHNFVNHWCAEALENREDNYLDEFQREKYEPTFCYC